MNEKLKKVVKVFFVIFLVGIILFNNSETFGALNPDNENEIVEVDDNGNVTDRKANKKDFFDGFIGRVAGVAIGPLTWAIAFFANAIVLGLYGIMYIAFSPFSGSGNNGFPFPDKIIFNKLSFFDPNFINPNLDSSAPINMLQDVIKNFYYTGFIIACGIFIISAMFIGIKLAISSLAEEKAHYKQALTSWIAGIAMLFLAHFFMYAIFTVNEIIVAKVSEPAKNVKFTLNYIENIPVAGKTLSTIFHSFQELKVDEENEGSTQRVGNYALTGYEGIISKITWKAVGGDLIYTIILGIILGQTCALIFMYIKRLFYCILLGIMAPLIIATDILKKSVGNGKTNLINNWFKNFALTVFLQSFQAIFLLVIMVMLGKISRIGGTVNDVGKNDIILGIMSAFAIMSLVKLEKIIKQLFGIEDGMVGDIKTSGAKMFGSFKLGKQMYDNAIKEPAERGKKARRKISEVGNGLGIKNLGKYATETDLPDGNSKSIDDGFIYDNNGYGPQYDTGYSNAGYSYGESYGYDSNLAAASDPIASKEIEKEVSTYGNSSRESNEVKQILRNIEKNTAKGNTNNISNITNNKELTKSEKDARKERLNKLNEYNAAVTEARAARKDSKWSKASAIAGMSIGLGMHDELSEAVITGGVISNIVDKKIQEHIDDSQKVKEYKATGKNNYMDKKYMKKIKNNVKEDTGLKSEIRDLSNSIKQLKNTRTSNNVTNVNNITNDNRVTNNVSNNTQNLGRTKSNDFGNNPIRMKNNNASRNRRNTNVDDL